MKWLFWACVIGAVYSYALYPLLLKAIPKRRSTARTGLYLPLVSLIIACRNEEKRLRHKIENALETHYSNKEVLVASDASDDGSHAIAESFHESGVILIRSAERRGKEYAQGLAIEAAKGEIIVFSDAGTDLPADSIDAIVDSFRDLTVGAVSSEDQFVSKDGKLVGEGAYVRYEMWLRQLESERKGLVGMSGSFFAVRKSVLRSWDSTIPSDFACALKTVQAGLVAISNPLVRGIYSDISDPSREYGRKVRTAIRGMTAVAKEARVLNPWRHGLFSIQVWSHKVMRWLVPWFLAGLLFCSFFLADAAVGYRVFLWLQVTGYSLVLVAHFMPQMRALLPLRLAYYFLQANLALAVAGVQFISGRRVVVWNPSAR